MKKYLIAIVLVLGLGSGVQAATGGLIAGSEADFYTISIGTGTSIFTGAGVVDEVCVSTGNGSAFAAFYDTGSVNSTNYATLLVSTLEVVGAMNFSSGTVVNTGGSLNAQPACWTAPFGRGVRVASGLYIFQSSAVSGESNRVQVYWRRD